MFKWHVVKPMEVDESCFIELLAKPYTWLSCKTFKFMIKSDDAMQHQSMKFIHLKDIIENDLSL
jgi:hypothetical protein